MHQELTNVEWNHLKVKLKQAYPQLNRSDLEWRNGSTNDLLWMISLKLKISRKELMEVIKKLEQD